MIQMSARREWSYFVVMALAAVTHGCQGEQGETGIEGAAATEVPEAESPAEEGAAEPAEAADEMLLAAEPEAEVRAWAGSAELEPNDARASAADAPLGLTQNLSIT